MAGIKNIRPTPGGYQIRIRTRGNAYTETVKGKTKSTLAEAIKRRDYLLARIEAGLPLKDEKTALRLFGETAEEYLDTLEGRDSTVIEYYRILNNFWRDLWNIPIQEITGADLKRILAGMKVSSKTKGNRLIPVYGVFKYAEIPSPSVKIRKDQSQKIERYSPKEREDLLSRLCGQEKVYFSLLFGTGVRPGEALALTWQDYDGTKIEVTKSISKRRLGPTKTGVRRTVYVPRWVRPILNGHTTRFAGGYIFVNSHGTPYLDTDIFNSAWRDAHRRSRIPYRIPYTCRHTRAAELLSAGVQPAAAAKQLGHSVEMFLRVYSEFIEEYSNQDMTLFDGIGHGVGTEKTAK